MKSNYHYFLIAFISLAVVSFQANGQQQNNPTSNHGNKFEQLGTLLSDPNVYRTASGAPGHQYWQQKADYVIDVEVDDENQRVIGSETITYTNN